jgi:hypothetical protein
MTELCPTGYEESPFFLFLFLQCLPKELWIVLGDVQATATQADKLWSLHNHQQHGFVVSVNYLLFPLLLCSPLPPSPPSRVSHLPAAASRLGCSLQPCRAGPLLCFFHRRHGDKTDICEGDCRWQGN